MMPALLRIGGPRQGDQTIIEDNLGTLWHLPTGIASPMTIAPVLRAPLFLSPAPVLRAPLSLPTVPLAAEPLPQSHSQVAGCEGLGLAALRHTQRLLAQLLQQALHRSSCVPVENQEWAAFIFMPPPRPPVTMSNLMAVRQLPYANCMRRSQCPIGQCPIALLKSSPMRIGVACAILPTSSSG